MPSPSAYLFLELSILAFAIGVGWEHWNLKRLCSPKFLLAAFCLALVWFCLDEIAVHLGLWTFPDGGTLPFRFLSLPIEEYMLFFLHTLICFLFVGLCSRTS
jgi:lycopene cyclase domain-containing protein